MSFQVKCEICGVRVDADPQMVGHQMVCPECGQQFVVPITSIAAGLVEGDFWIQKSFGTGNIGEAFLAKRLASNEKIILKALTPAVTVDPMATQAYLVQLQQAASAIDHPNFSNVVEVSEMADHKVCVMPYVPGKCLDQLITQNDPMDERDALKAALKVARFMRIGWEQSRLVHGSIRPGNILLDNEGDPHILEAGNFKRILAGNTLSLDHLNKAGTVADYMSPEEAQGAQLDCRSDIYSLGATLFFMLTGSRPYNGTNTTEVLHNHLNAPVPDPQDYNNNISDDAADLIADMMAKNPDERFQSWRELTDEIKSLLRASKPGTETELALKTQLHMRVAQHEAPAAKKEKNIMVFAIAGIVGALLLLLLIVGVVATVMGNKPPKNRPPVNPPPNNGQTNIRDPRNPRTTVFDKKVETIMKYYEKDKAKNGLFAVERLQMLEATAAKTDGDKKVIKAKIAQIQGEMKKTGGQSTNKPPSNRPPTNRPPPKTIPGSKAALDKGYVSFMFIGPLETGKKDKIWEGLKKKSKIPNGLPNFRSKINKTEWRKLYKPTDQGEVDYSNKAGAGNQGGICFFAFATITTTSAVKARIHVTHDDGMTVWLNQRQLYDSDTLAFNKAVDVDLQKGQNVVATCVSNDGGGMKFRFALTDRNNRPLPGSVKLECPPY